MNGRGRALDNVFVQRLCRTVKCEEIHLRDYADVWWVEKSRDRLQRLTGYPPRIRLLRTRGVSSMEC
jgi:hypothetical protein